MHVGEVNHIAGGTILMGKHGKNLSQIYVLINKWSIWGHQKYEMTQMMMRVAILQIAKQYNSNIIIQI